MKRGPMTALPSYLSTIWLLSPYRGILKKVENRENHQGKREKEKRRRRERYIELPLSKKS